MDWQTIRRQCSDLDALSNPVHSPAVRRLRYGADRSSTRLLVLGGPGEGKSALINALLGRDVLLRGVRSVPMLVTEVRMGGPERIEVEFLPQPRFPNRDTTMVRPLAELDRLLSRHHNGADWKGLGRVAVFLASGLAVEYLEVTPSDDPHELRSARFHEICGDVDAAVLVSSVQRPPTNGALDLIGLVSRAGVEVAAVVTKCDLVDEDRAELVVREVRRAMAEVRASPGDQITVLRCGSLGGPEVHRPQPHPHRHTAAGPGAHKRPIAAVSDFISLHLAPAADAARRRRLAEAAGAHAALLAGEVSTVRARLEGQPPTAEADLRAEIDSVRHRLRARVAEAVYAARKRASSGAQTTSAGMAARLHASLDSLVDDMFEPPPSGLRAVLPAAGEALIHEQLAQGVPAWHRTLVDELADLLRPVQAETIAAFALIDKVMRVPDVASPGSLLYRPDGRLPGLTLPATDSTAGHGVPGSAPASLARSLVARLAMPHPGEQVASWWSFDLGRRMVSHRLHRQADRSVQQAMTRARDRVLFAFDHEVQALARSIEDNLDLRQAGLQWIEEQTHRLSRKPGQEATDLASADLAMVRRQAEQLVALSRAFQGSASPEPNATAITAGDDEDRTDSPPATTLGKG